MRLTISYFDPGNNDPGNNVVVSGGDRGMTLTCYPPSGPGVEARDITADEMIEAINYILRRREAQGSDGNAQPSPDECPICEESLHDRLTDMCEHYRVRGGLRRLRRRRKTQKERGG